MSVEALSWPESLAFNITLAGTVMRFQQLSCCVLGLVVGLFGGSQCLAAEQNPANPDSPPSAAALRLIVITDDDFLAAAHEAWCARALNRSIEEFRQTRPGTELQLEMRPAGPPAILCGGRPAVGPRRAIGFLCDQEAKIVGFCVGVPTGRQLAALVEDADEVAVLCLADLLQAPASDAETEPQDLLVEALHQRAGRRVLRHYRPLVHKIKRQTPLAEAAALLQPALAADRGERFLVLGLPDAVRWVSAQQHTETMRHWCEAMLPSLAGRSIDAIWQDVATLLWESQPWHIPAQDADLVDWYTQSMAAGPVILWVQTPQTLLGLPPAGENAELLAPPIEGQTQLWLDQVEHRIVGLPAVAHLLQHRKDKAVDFQRAERAFSGWIVLSDQATPTVVSSSAERRLADTLRKMLASP